MSSATLRKILSYILPLAAVLLLAYPSAFDFLIGLFKGVVSLFRFPIPGRVNEWGEYFPLSEGARIRLSLICYQFMLAMFATIPLYRAKRFEDSQFYNAYKVFWWFNAPIFSMILIMVWGAAAPLPATMSIEYILTFIINVIFIAIFSALILTLTLTPAYFQHKKQINRGS